MDLKTEAQYRQELANAWQLIDAERAATRRMQDVTLKALVAVAEHAAHFGKPVEITGPDGKLKYRITVEAF